MHDLLSSAMSDESIRETLSSGKIDQIEETFDVLWYELPSRFANEILDATNALDPSVFLRRPRLMHLTLLAHHQLDYVDRDPDLGKILQTFNIQGRHYSNVLNEFTNPSELLSAGTTALIAARLDGAYRRADQLGTWLDDRLSTVGTRNMLPWSTHHVRTKPGWLSTQRGLTATLSGDLDYAIRLYTRGFTEAGTAPWGHFAGANAAANLALIAACRGHLDIARVWIERMEGVGPLPHWIEHLTVLGAKIAAALVAASEGDAELAQRHLDRVGPATQHVELWPFIIHARAIYHAAYGDPYDGLRELEAARLTHGALSPEHGVIRDLLLRAEALLLLGTHNAGRVLNLARRDPEHFPPQYTAWAHLYAGDSHKAIKTAARALHRSAERPALTTAIELHLAMAVGHMRNSDTEQAASSFRAALGMRSTPAQVRPFLSATRKDVTALATLAGVSDPLASTRLGRGNAATTPHAGMFVNLTPREGAVLHALDQGETAVAAARRFGVSPATVRSQVRSIYRKLGVGGRQAALARADELGLLSTKH